MSGTSYDNSNVIPMRKSSPAGIFSRWMEDMFFGQSIGTWLLFVATITLFLVVWSMFLTDVRDKLGQV